MHRGHSNDESEQVIDHGVKASVAEKAPRKMGHALQLIVDVQLRCHQDETKRVHECLRERESGVRRDRIGESIGYIILRLWSTRYSTTAGLTEYRAK